MNSEVFKLYHNNPIIQTLEEFCQVSGIYFDKKYTINNLFEDNRQRIFDQMSPSDKISFIRNNSLKSWVAELKPSDLTINVKLPCPLTLLIPKRLVTYTMYAKHTDFQEPVFDTIAFEDMQIKSTLLEENVRLNNITNATRERAKCSVIGFFKTLYYRRLEEDKKKSGNPDGIYQTKSNFTDISDFIFQLSTNVGQQGGSFTFSLPHIPLYRNFVKSGKGDVKDTMEEWFDLDAIREGLYNTSGEDNEYAVVKTPIDSLDYFNWLISPNDLIFISFDEINPKTISDDNIAGNAFDMIGLVDSVSLSRDANGNTTVNVSGRDLMKLLSEDSVLFFPCATAVNQGNFFDNTEGALRTGDLSGIATVNGKITGNDAGDEVMMRMPSTGSIRLFAQECNGFSIDYIIKVVIRSLTNMQICPSEIFSSWKDRRTKFSYLVPNKK